METTQSRARGTLSRLFGGLALVTALIFSGTFAASPAHAAPTLTYPDAITIESITNSTRTSGVNQETDTYRINARWSVDTKVAAEETFGMHLPEEFSRSGESFGIPDQDGHTLATCQIEAGAAPQVVCTFTDRVTDLDITGGDFWLEVRATKSTTHNQVTFVLNGTNVMVDLPNGGGIEGYVAPPGITGAEKYSWNPTQNGSNGYPQIAWTIRFNSSLAQNGHISITDSLTTGSTVFEDHILDSYEIAPGIEKWIDVLWMSIDGNGQLTGPQTFLDESEYEFVKNTDGAGFTLSLDNVPANENREYRVEYRTVPTTAPFTGDTFENTAVLNGNPVTHYDHTYTSAGGGNGQTATRFRISKAVAGDGASLVPADTIFTVEYQIGEAKYTLPFGIGTGGLKNSERFAPGTSVTIREITPPSIEGVTWSNPVLTGTGVRNNGDGSFTVAPTGAPVELVLTNTATRTVVVPPVDPPVIPPVDPPVIPPVDPPVIPPVDPPVIPPVDPPVIPPVDPPVIPPVDPPVIPPVDPPVDPPVETPETPERDPGSPERQPETPTPAKPAVPATPQATASSTPAEVQPVLAHTGGSALAPLAISGSLMLLAAMALVTRTRRAAKPQ